MAAQAMVTEEAELGCVLIPIGDTHLLLPNVSIAEIVPWRRIKPADGAPRWCVGMLGWRGETVPVMRFELLNGATVPIPPRGRCIVIMNRARSPNGRPFYGFTADGLPRLVKLTPEDVVNKPVRLGPAEIAAVRVGTEPAVVPNLSYIEEQLTTLR